MTLVVMIVGVCMLVACGGAEGTYKFYAVVDHGEAYFVGDKFGDKLTEDYCTLELKSDGTGVITFKFGEDEDDVQVLGGTWSSNKSDSNIIEIKYSKYTLTAIRNGKDLTLYVGNLLGNNTILLLKK